MYRTTAQHRLLTTTAATLIAVAATAAPAIAVPDPGPPLTVTTVNVSDHAITTNSCPISRVGTQFVRCDNLTGNAVEAPPWIQQA